MCKMGKNVKNTNFEGVGKKFNMCFGTEILASYVKCLTQVPLFQHMDSLVLENICDRVKPLIFTKGETVSLSNFKSFKP